MTSEPDATQGRLYVIQKHAATRLHFDLRLELGGVLKSWAVTRGPSFDPTAKRLAIEVEDHALSYGTFEGTIPKGSYGGGTVMLWDRGVWQPLGEPEAGYAAGRLRFRLMGQRLTGGWVLVRMRPKGGKPPPWLLIKERDEAAGQPEPAGEDDRSVSTGRTMAEIAAA